jgi:16S rRNA (cytosine967-C5)-methyltransferase
VTPGARLQAAIEILDAVIAAARDEGPAADTLVARYFQDRRYAGSKDRRAVRELVYDAIRSQGERPASGRAAMIAHARRSAPELLALFGTGGHGPSAVGDDEGSPEAQAAPAWIVDRLRARFGDAVDGELEALLGRAPLDLRANRLRTTRDEVAGEMAGVEPTTLAPDGLRADGPLNVERHPAYLGGRVEIQDEGSQLACVACDAKPGGIVVDLCAGGGGKTLALAAAMANRGRLIASDANRDRLGRLAPRAARAGAAIIETRLLDPGREIEAFEDVRGTADLVLVDAPCSGTGTWRRNPEARWRLTPSRLEQLTKLQAHLLDVGAALLRPGGRLVYVVCSLLPDEGEAHIDAFLTRNAGWGPAPLQLPKEPATATRAVLTPARHGTDGFFIAGLSSI